MRIVINLQNVARTVIKGKHISLSKSIVKTTAERQSKEYLILEMMGKYLVLKIDDKCYFDDRSGKK